MLTTACSEYSCVCSLMTDRLQNQHLVT